MTPPVSDWMSQDENTNSIAQGLIERERQTKKKEERERDSGEKVAERQMGSGIEHQKKTV